MNKFDKFRFEGLNCRDYSNAYYTMNRVSEDEKKIVVKVADNHLIPTKYGYALVLDHLHVVFLKDWQVDANWFGNEVLINRDFWNVKEWGVHDAFVENEEALTFEHWLLAAKEQDDFINEDGLRSNYVKWHK